MRAAASLGSSIGNGKFILCAKDSWRWRIGGAGMEKEVVDGGISGRNGRLVCNSSLALAGVDGPDGFVSVSS